MSLNLLVIVNVTVDYKMFYLISCGRNMSTGSREGVIALSIHSDNIQNRSNKYK